MKWFRDLYVSESIGDKANRIKWRIDHNAGTVRVYLIAFASNPDNLLDIIPAWNLMQRGYPKREVKVIGMAKGYDDALALVRDIIDETYQNTGGVDVWSYLREERRRRL
ncbi:MAG: hypothetical protein NC180_04140 [Muribaculaceae bacterium]|nr:hypothetical protein [Roseburia sp.]MCM1430407.1 hypothetical protein [Muribaculaceae bacterium]MCM1492397.1 hypothetical protein [Muribaculaceae bacterium]